MKRVVFSFDSIAHYKSKWFFKQKRPISNPIYKMKIPNWDISLKYRLNLKKKNDNFKCSIDSNIAYKSMCVHVILLILKIVIIIIKMD